MARSLNSDYLAQLFIRADTSKMDRELVEGLLQGADLPEEAKALLVFKRGCEVHSAWPFCMSHPFGCIMVYFPALRAPGGGGGRCCAVGPKEGIGSISAENPNKADLGGPIQSAPGLAFLHSALSYWVQFCPDPSKPDLYNPSEKGERGAWGGMQGADIGRGQGPAGLQARARGAPCLGLLHSALCLWTHSLMPGVGGERSFGTG